MNARRDSVALVAMLVLGAAPALSGQGSDPRPTLGVSYGVESVPTALDPVCAYSDPRHTDGALGGYLAFPIGPVAIQPGITVHPRGEINCADALIEHHGVATTRLRHVPGGDFITVDLRLRLGSARTGWWHATVGGGWVGSGKALPYVAGSIGTRFGVPLRVGFDVDLRYYRIPSVIRTAEYDMGAVLAVLSQVARVDWERSTTFRIVVELPTGRDAR
jgi:hypothetical protein